MPSVGAPDIERSLGLSHSATAVVLFTAPGLLQLVLDPVIFVLADRLGRATLVRGGLAAMAVTMLVAAIAPGPITLACALSIWGIATGAAASLTEATLVDLWPERRARTLARWSLLAMVGDLLAPLMLGGLAVLGMGTTSWRIGFAIVGALCVVWTIAVVVRRFPVAASASAPGDDEPSLWQGVRAAIRDRRLVGWLFGMALCDLLDEILVVFASLRVRELGASAAAQSVTVGAFIAGGGLGLVLLDRLLLRYTERQLMIASGVACAVTFAVWLAAPTVWLASVLMVPVGMASAPLYPLATAQAYACRPDRSGVVLVAGHLFAPVALALPWLLGMVADHAGVPAALALLIVQPVGLVVLALVTRPVTTGDRGSRDSRTAGAP